MAYPVGGRGTTNGGPTGGSSTPYVGGGGGGYSGAASFYGGGGSYGVPGYGIVDPLKKVLAEIRLKGGGDPKRYGDVLKEGLGSIREEAEKNPPSEFAGHSGMFGSLPDALALLRHGGNSNRDRDSGRIGGGWVDPTLSELDGPGMGPGGQILDPLTVFGTRRRKGDQVGIEQLRGYSSALGNYRGRPGPQTFNNQGADFGQPDTFRKLFQARMGGGY